MTTSTPASGPPRSEPPPEIALASGSLFVADLHLDSGTAASVAGFVGWLDALDQRPVLVVLGDLFDVWVGPAQAELAGARAVIDALARLAGRGTRIVIVPGNRDFLLDPEFARRARAEIAPEGFVGMLERVGAKPSRVLCLHGDTLCTLDLGYQRLRRVLRSRVVLAVAPRIPRALGLRLARRLRRASVRAIAAKLPEEKSMQRAACRELALQHAADVVVCGHAHAFRDEPAGEGVRWIVLDAFGGPQDVLTVVDRGLEVSASARLA